MFDTALPIPVTVGPCLHDNVAQAGFRGGGGRLSVLRWHRGSKPAQHHALGGMEEKDKNEHVCM